MSQLIRLLLEREGVHWQSVRLADDAVISASEIPAPRSVVRAAVFADDSGILVALYPADRALQQRLLEEALHRSLRPLHEPEVARLQATLATALRRALPVRLQVIIDEHLTDQDRVHVEEAPGTFLRVESDQFNLLSQQALIGSVFTAARQAGRGGAADAGGPRLDIRDRLATLDRLPPMPELAARIVRLRANPLAGAAHLAEVVALDPGLAAQVLRYANSALFGQRGRIKTLEDAIIKVLGFETVMSIALGVAAARQFRLPAEGPLGAAAFWRNSVFSAALVQALAATLPRGSHSPTPGTAYLAGLLHDVGLLVLGQLFRPEFFWLNKLSASKPEIPLQQLERQLLGLTHAELGGLLLDTWNLPPEIRVAVEHRHRTDYAGEHALYARLVLLADRLLRAHRMSYAESEEIPETLLSELGLSEEQAVLALNRVIEDSEALEGMSRQLVA